MSGGGICPGKMSGSRIQNDATSTGDLLVRTWTLAVNISAYMSQTRDPLTISEVAADWRELMMYRSALCDRPLPVLTESCTRGATSRHTTAQINHTNPQSASYNSVPVPLRGVGWVVLITQYVSNWLEIACSGPGEKYDSDTLSQTCCTHTVVFHTLCLAHSSVNFHFLFWWPLRPVYSDATQLNSTSSWVELRRYKPP